MDQQLILTSMQPNELAALFTEVATEAMRKVLADSMPCHSTQSEQEDKLLSRKETAKLLKISLTTLHDKMRTGSIPFKKIGRRILFQESEVMAAITPAKRRRR